MQQDFQRFKRRKIFLRKVMWLVVLCIVMALLLVLMRGCSEKFSHPYDSGYHPMDTHRLDGGQP